MYKLIPMILVSCILLLGGCNITNENKIKLARPTKQQLAFMDMEVGAFIHYGLNVYTGQEHGDGFEPASKFNPTDLDAEQWVLAAKALGAKYAVLTARHEGGFCLWPTQATDYSIANSPYKDGKGDIVRDFVNACRTHGIKPGVYLTASHDAHHIYQPEDNGKVKWGKASDGLADRRFAEMTPQQRQAYIDIQVTEMTELLSNYGPITYVWCDHWNAAATTPESTAYQQTTNAAWRAVTEVMRKLQPDCIMMGPDTWVPGNETGHVVYPMWNAVNTVDGTVWSRPAATKADHDIPNDYGLLETGALAGHPLGKFWRSRECTTNSGFHRGGWFWHPHNVKKTEARPLADHINLYYRTVGLGANTIINLPPDNRGQVPDDIVASAEAFGAEIQKRFANPIAELKRVKKSDIVELKWKTPTEINTIVTMENIVNGQRVAKYTFDAWVDGQWVELKAANNLKAAKPYNPNPGFETIGHKKIDRVEPVTTNRIRFRCLESVVAPAEIRSIQVYNCAPIDQATK